MAVNLSARRSRKKDLVEVVRKALEDTGLPPGMLELEITESTAMDDVVFTREVLGGLRELGINSSLDDCGTGYSSLSQLSTLPVETPEELEFVREHGCDQVQGFLFSRPVPAEEATVLVARGAFAL